MPYSLDLLFLETRVLQLHPTFPAEYLRLESARKDAASPPPLLCAVPATASATAEVPVCVLLCPAVSTSKVVTLVL